MNNEVATLKSFFVSLQIHVSDIWVESCITWCKSEVLSPNYTANDLQSKVFEQWLLLDLRDLEVSCLPPNLSSQKFFTLNGNFCLQMMQVVDISKPKLWQLQRIRNNHALTRGTQQETDVVGTGKRVLQLTLTDGIQEIKAIEYRPIPSLSINLPPGVKIRIIGPVVVRRGRLMLEQQNVKVLGGDVEELSVSHHPENVLARSLKLPENQNPVKIEEKLLTVEADNEEARTNSVMNKPRPLENRPQPFTNNPQPPDRPSSSRSQLPNCSENRPKPPQSNILPTVSSFITDEEERLSREIDMLLEAERDMNQAPPKKTKTPDLFENMDIDDEDFDKLNVNQPPPKKTKTPDFFDNMDFDEEDFDKLDQLITSTQVNPTKPPQENKLVPQNFDDDDDDVFNDIDIDAHLDKIEKQSEDQKPPSREKPLDQKSPSQEKPPDWKPPSQEKPPDQNLPSPAKPPIVTIAKLLENRISSGNFKIKARFKSVVEKLTMTEDEYKLIIKIEDDTSDLTVKLHSDIITGFTGYAPAAIMALKSSILVKDESAVDKIYKAMQNVKEKLLKLDNIMMIQIRREEMPVIIRLIS